MSTRQKSIGCIIGALLGLAGIAQATVVFNFDGANANAATANTNIVSTANVTLNTGESYTINRSYSTSTALLSNNGSTYTGQSIHGGFSASYNNAPSTYKMFFGILQYIGTASEQLQVNITASNNISRTSGWALMFGTTTNTGSYKFDASSQLTAKQYSTLNGISEARWVVVANGTTYLSQSTIALAVTSTTNTLNNPDEINWAAWNPGADMTFGSLSYTNLGSSLNNITLAGVAVNSNAGSGDPYGTGGRYYLQGFTGDVIPEPATVGMLGLGALITLVLRRKLTR